MPSPVSPRSSNDGSLSPTRRLSPPGAPSRPRFSQRRTTIYVTTMTITDWEQDSISQTPSVSPLNPRPRVIYFYDKDKPYYGFTNFAARPIVYNGRRYPTSEHLFQSFKFLLHNPNLAEHIRTCSERPAVALAEARRFAPEVRKDWKEVNVAKMEEALLHKFNQHPDLKQQLLATGDAQLIEDSPIDAFWGRGPDHRGRNELGRALERLRNQLRST